MQTKLFIIHVRLKVFLFFSYFGWGESWYTKAAVIFLLLIWWMFCVLYSQLDDITGPAWIDRPQTIRQNMSGRREDFPVAAQSPYLAITCSPLKPTSHRQQRQVISWNYSLFSAHVDQSFESVAGDVRENGADGNRPPMATVLLVADFTFLCAIANRAGGTADEQTDGQLDNRLFADHFGRASWQARLINFGCHHVRSQADWRTTYPTRRCLFGPSIQWHQIRFAADH